MHANIRGKIQKDLSGKCARNIITEVLSYLINNYS